MSVDMSQFYQVFFEEAAEHLAAMESLLLQVDIDSPDPDVLNAIFRAAHSVKGGSGTFGFTDMTEVTHVLETLLDKVRKNEMPLRSEMIDVFLEAGDVLKEQLDGHQSGTETNSESANTVCRKLDLLANADNTHTEVANSTPLPAVSTPEQLFHIRFTPAAGSTASKDMLDNIATELRELGTLKVNENAGHNCREFELQTFASEDVIRDMFAFVAQPEEVAIEAGNVPAEDPGYGFFTDDATTARPAQDDGYGFFTEIETASQETAQDPGYGFFTDLPAQTTETEARAASIGRRAADNPDVPVARTGRRDSDKVAVSAQSDASSIRVNIDKVDQLINLVGELVITQAMLTQTASEVDPVIYEKLLNGMAQLERNTRDLQESVMSIRMMPIGFVFSRFPRVVRDLAGKLGKQIELKTFGEGTELDKGLIEKLADPLTHLVRNSIDHGIESPDTRIASGKDPKGTISLRAFHQGGNIIIEVGDDGAGLNRDKILAKARERGLAVHDGMPDQEVWQLIFAPGFSTAEVVTDVSGRGVGMDVVKRNIHEMGGKVEISCESGHGTTISIRLPLTLAILDGMSIAVGGQVFIIPLTFISESLQPVAADIKTVSGQGQVAQVRGEYLPLIALHKIFNIETQVTEPEQGILVLLETDGKKVALFVDELVGQHQVVLKSLESNYRKVPCVSGATIMGDGRVALILDVAAVVRINQG